MKWPTDPRPPRPNLDDIRRRRVFVWWPRRCDDGYTRWLTWVWKVEVWRKGLVLTPSPVATNDPWVVGWHVLGYEAEDNSVTWPAA